MSALETPLPLLANANLCHTLSTLLLDFRSDQRQLLEYRPISFKFDRSDGRAMAEVALGTTLAMCEVSAAVSEPWPDRPMEGTIFINVEFTAMADGSVEAGRNNAEASEISRILEKQIRDARAIDMESLCIRPGKSVWSIRCDLRILQNGGNLIDACALATMAALLHFRRADVTVRTADVLVHSSEERSPHPLSIHHVPLCVTFGLLHTSAFAPLQAAIAAGQYPAPPEGRSSTPSSTVILLDPTRAEERASAGSRATFVLNAHKELCGVHKAGGCPLPPATLAQCAKVGAEKVAQLVSLLTAALRAADESYEATMREAHKLAHGYG